MKFFPITRTRRKVGRNEACSFCTSGLKFKRCHGKPVSLPPDEATGFVCVVPVGPVPAKRERLEA